MANRSMIRIDEREDQLRRIFMFFDIDFSDGLTDQWDSTVHLRYPGGGLEKVKESSTSFGEPNKFYSYCNYNVKGHKKTISTFNEYHPPKHQHQHRHPDQRSLRDNSDYDRRGRHLPYRLHRLRSIPAESPLPPADLLDYEYNTDNYGTDRAYRTQNYHPEPDTDIRESEIAVSHSYQGIESDYPPPEVYPRYGSHYDYYSTRSSKRPPPIPLLTPIPFDYYSYADSPPQREYKYSSRHHELAEPPTILPRLARHRKRQASGAMPCDYPPILGHGVRQDYSSYTPDYSYDNYSERKSRHGHYSQYATRDYYDQSARDYDYYDTPRHQVSSYYNDAKSTLPPEPIPNQFDLYTGQKGSHKSSHNHEYRDNRPKPPPKKYKTNFHAPKTQKYPSHPRDCHEVTYRRTTKPAIRKKSLEPRGVAGFDVDTEIPHKIIKPCKTKMSSAASQTKTNHSYKDTFEGQNYVRFSGVDIPYKKRRNSSIIKCESTTEKRHDSGCDYQPCSPNCSRNNVSRVSVACQRSCLCQGSQASIGSSRRSFYETRRAHRKSIKQRISGFLRKSKVCLKRTKRKISRPKRMLNNAQTQCSACNELNKSSRNSLRNTGKSCSGITVRNKWYSKRLRKNIFPDPSNSRMTSSRQNACRRCRPAYPTVYREKSTCNVDDPYEENYQHYSMLHCECPCPMGRAKFKSKKSLASLCDSNEDNMEDDYMSSDCGNPCCKVNNIRTNDGKDNCASQESVPNKTCCRCRSKGNPSKSSNVNVCLTIRAEDVNIRTSCINEPKQRCKCPPCNCDEGSPSADTLKCPATVRFSKNALKNDSECSLALSRCASISSSMSRPRRISPRNSFSSLSNSSLNKKPCSQPPPCLVRRDPNSMTPRPSKRVCLNTNCSVISEQKTCAKRPSQESCVRKYPSSESIRKICKCKVPKRSCSETTLNSNCPPCCPMMNKKNSERSVQISPSEKTKCCCLPRKCASESSINSRKSGCTPRTVCTNKTSAASCTPLTCVAKRRSNDSCTSQTGSRPTCSSSKTKLCCRKEEEEKVCLCRSAIEELKEELLEKLQCQQRPGYNPTPEVMFLPCVPDAFVHRTGSVTNPFGKSYMQSIMCWGQYSQMPGPI